MPTPCRKALEAQVAPFTGAWIEMSNTACSRYCPRSLPSRERGLKFLAHEVQVALDLSLPSRERGLKSSSDDLKDRWPESLPSRERGLKFSLIQYLSN